MAPWHIRRTYRDRLGRLWRIELLRTPGEWHAYTYAGALRRARRELTRSLRREPWTEEMP